MGNILYHFCTTFWRTSLAVNKLAWNMHECRKSIFRSSHQEVLCKEDGSGDVVKTFEKYSWSSYFSPKFQTGDLHLTRSKAYIKAFCQKHKMLLLKQLSESIYLCRTRVGGFFFLSQIKHNLRWITQFSNTLATRP